MTVLVLDGASALAFIIVAATRQRITPDRLRGRVLAASTAVTATVRMLAVAAVGALIEAFGPNAVLAALAVSAAPFLLVLVLTGDRPVASCGETSSDELVHSGDPDVRTEST